MSPHADVLIERILEVATAKAEVTFDHLEEWERSEMLLAMNEAAVKVFKNLIGEALVRAEPMRLADKLDRRDEIEHVIAAVLA